MNSIIQDILIPLFLIAIYFLFDKYIFPLKLGKKLEETKNEFTREFSTELEEIKSSLSKEKFIHELQFKEEFKIYLELWKKVIDLKEATDLILPVIDIVDPNKSDKEIKKERLEVAQKAYQELRKVIIQKRPFYSRKVYKKSGDILKESIKKAMHYQYPPEDIPDRYQKAMDISKEIKKIIDEINQSIRDRIQIMEEEEAIK